MAGVVPFRWVAHIYAGRVPDQTALKRSYSVPAHQRCVAGEGRNDVGRRGANCEFANGRRVNGSKTLLRSLCRAPHASYSAHVYIQCCHYYRCHDVPECQVAQPQLE